METCSQRPMSRSDPVSTLPNLAFIRTRQTAPRQL